MCLARVWGWLTLRRSFSWRINVNESRLVHSLGDLACAVHVLDLLINDVGDVVQMANYTFVPQTATWGGDFLSIWTGSVRWAHVSNSDCI